MEVDASELPRRLLHTRLTIPSQPGKLRLWYPKWFPGAHGPYGRVEDVGGLRLETDQGKVLPWRRDEVELHCVQCEVPDGVREVRVQLDTICNTVSANAGGIYSYGNHSLGVLNWHTCLLYPDGPSCTAIQVRLRVKLPAKWRFATALKVDAEKDGQVAFQTVSLSDLIDCPLIAGEQLRTIKLDSGNSPPAFLHLVSESPRALQLDQKVINFYSGVVKEAFALFGAAHYPEYHFLVVCSDELGYFGLEHHSSCLNGVRERDLIEDKHRKGWIANLLPHEYAHSWCGKFRRPAAMCTTDFHTPQKMKLLWVYEGLTMYLGDLLMIRSGLISPAEYRDMLAWTIGDQMRREGRRWRSLEDTAVASYLLRGPSANWNDLRREQDYYPEGLLLWLEIDVMIRELSRGRYSLDDFCKKFMGPISATEKVVPYDFPEIVKILKELADYDWEQFLSRRVSASLENLPLDVVGRSGYRLQYANKPSAYLEYLQESSRRPGFISARDSLGLTFSVDGRITNVIPGMAGDKAKLAPGMQVIAVNSKKFSRERLADALADSVALRKIEFLLLEGDQFRTIIVDYADGPRYLELTRDEKKPDILAEILKPVSGK
jgi:predicted metalloprotease with PDZ domain